MQNRALNILVSIAALTMPVSGCRTTHQQESATKSLAIAVDVSDKSPARLLAYASVAYKMQRQMNENDVVRIYEFANRIELIYEGPPIHGRNQFNKEVASRFVSERATMDRRGTRTDLVLERLLVDAQRQVDDLCVILLTDGGMEDLSTQVCERISSSVDGFKNLSSLRHLLVAGVNQEWRSRWEDWVVPIDSITTVRGMNDMDSVDMPDLWVRSK